MPYLKALLLLLAPKRSKKLRLRSPSFHSPPPNHTLPTPRAPSEREHSSRCRESKRATVTRGACVCVCLCVCVVSTRGAIVVAVAVVVAVAAIWPLGGSRHLNVFFELALSIRVRNSCELAATFCLRCSALLHTHAASAKLTRQTALQAATTSHRTIAPSRCTHTVHFSLQSPR